MCLHSAGVIDRETAATLLTTLAELEASDAPTRGGGERDLIPALGGNEDLGSLINLGRTMQEPMGRLQMRDQLLDFFEHLFALIETLTTVAEQNVDTMLNHVRQGYSCMTEVVVHMVRELGYGGRRANRICATLVRLARERGIPAPRLTGEMLDGAARLVEEEPPGIDTDTLRQLLDPVAFIESHSSVGGPAPVETRRMLRNRREMLAEARERQAARARAVEKGRQLLASEIARICDGAAE